ncbi:MAG TPA: transglycosylase domain-containing protein, partial [Acidimicrobiales bacterium]|nr:transglycosylase domain-containing protein [Acidimicrobiales bacterium]
MRYRYDEDDGRRWGRLFLRTGAGILVALVLIGIVPPFRRVAATALSKVILVVASPLAPSVGDLESLSRASRGLATDGSEVGLLGAEQREVVALDSLPRHVLNAVLAAEDASFYSHSGVDPAAVLRAALNTAKGDSQGGSTITQQLAKLNYAGSSRTVLRKLREVLYASELESRYSKDELLERYLNQVYFGEGAYGIGLASETFFAVPPERLSVEQAATLAGKIRAPSTLDPYGNPAVVRERRDQVLRNMSRHGWIGGAELASALAAPLELAPRRPAPATAGKSPHFIGYVGREAAGLEDLGGPDDEARRGRVFTRGYTIETTFDPRAHDAAVESVKGTLGEVGDPTTAIASVEPGDGAIRVLFGGLDPGLQFDPASQGRRQPGSSFKPYVYLAMLEEGIDPRTTFDSGSPRTLSCGGGSWTVRNFEGEGGGAISVDDAMVGSVNTVFAQIMARVGPQATGRAAERMGISREAVSPPQCAMALGGLREGVSPLEQAAGFATFAARGTYAPPYAITRIRDRSGRVVYERSDDVDERAPSKEVGVLNGVLQRVVREGTGRAAAIDRPVAGKTGTTERNGNAWFIGYTPQLATAVWVGRPEGDVPMTDVRGIAVTGGSFPARIFSRYMRAAMAGKPVQQLYTVSPDELSFGGAPPRPP